MFFGGGFPFGGDMPGMGGMPGRGGGGGKVNNTRYYEELGVSKNATEQEIKKAHRKAALQHHPDKGEQERDQAPAEAHQRCLSEPGAAEAAWAQRRRPGPAAPRAARSDRRPAPGAATAGRQTHS